eukprot:TRINITY_DN2404_c0_g1_i1.p1 TRINITY_DN2404_c0_g1~~TRINITY_DN2404_c0_g1_i1.p1  ORF type:complete len:256 (+),score=24.92 TRINITY_DN2404_c0_g1_i1:238-1005(+)
MSQEIEEGLQRVRQYENDRPQLQRLASGTVLPGDIVRALRRRNVAQAQAMLCLTTLDQKAKLLVEAAACGDPDVLLAVVLFCERTLSSDLFSRLVVRLADASACYIRYLRESGQRGRLTEFLRDHALSHTEDRNLRGGHSGLLLVQAAIGIPPRWADATAAPLPETSDAELIDEAISCFQPDPSPVPQPLSAAAAGTTASSSSPGASARSVAPSPSSSLRAIGPHPVPWQKAALRQCSNVLHERERAGIQSSLGF